MCFLYIKIKIKDFFLVIKNKLKKIKNFFKKGIDKAQEK